MQSRPAVDAKRTDEKNLEYAQRIATALNIDISEVTNLKKKALNSWIKKYEKQVDLIPHTPSSYASVDTVSTPSSPSPLSSPDNDDEDENFDDSIVARNLAASISATDTDGTPAQAAVAVGVTPDSRLAVAVAVAPLDQAAALSAAAPLAAAPLAAAHLAAAHLAAAPAVAAPIAAPAVAAPTVAATTDAAPAAAAPAAVAADAITTASAAANESVKREDKGKGKANDIDPAVASNAAAPSAAAASDADTLTRNKDTTAAATPAAVTASTVDAFKGFFNTTVPSWFNKSSAAPAAATPATAATTAASSSSSSAAITSSSIGTPADATTSAAPSTSSSASEATTSSGAPVLVPASAAAASSATPSTSSSSSATTTSTTSSAQTPADIAAAAASTSSSSSSSASSTSTTPATAPFGERAKHWFEDTVTPTFKEKIAEPFSKNVADPFTKKVAEPFQEKVIDPVKNYLELNFKPEERAVINKFRHHGIDISEAAKAHAANNTWFANADQFDKLEAVHYNAIKHLINEGHTRLEVQHFDERHTDFVAGGVETIVPTESKELKSYKYSVDEALAQVVGLTAAQAHYIEKHNLLRVDVEGLEDFQIDAMLNGLPKTQVVGLKPYHLDAVRQYGFQNSSEFASLNEAQLSALIEYAIGFLWPFPSTPQPSINEVVSALQASPKFTQEEHIVAFKNLMLAGANPLQAIEILNGLSVEKVQCIARGNNPYAIRDLSEEQAKGILSGLGAADVANQNQFQINAMLKLLPRASVLTRPKDGLPEPLMHQQIRGARPFDSEEHVEALTQLLAGTNTSHPDLIGKDAKGNVIKYYHSLSRALELMRGLNAKQVQLLGQGELRENVAGLDDRRLATVQALKQHGITGSLLRNLAKFEREHEMALTYLVTKRAADGKPAMSAQAAVDTAMTISPIQMELLRDIDHEETMKVKIAAATATTSAPVATAAPAPVATTTSKTKEQIEIEQEKAAAEARAKEERQKRGKLALFTSTASPVVKTKYSIADVVDATWLKTKADAQALMLLLSDETKPTFTEAGKIITFMQTRIESDVVVDAKKNAASVLKAKQAALATELAPLNAERMTLAADVKAKEDAFAALEKQIEAYKGEITAASMKLKVTKAGSPEAATLEEQAKAAKAQLDADQRILEQVKAERDAARKLLDDKIRDAMPKVTEHDVTAKLAEAARVLIDDNGINTLIRYLSNSVNYAKHAKAEFGSFDRHTKDALVAYADTLAKPETRCKLVTLQELHVCLALVRKMHWSFADAELHVETTRKSDAAGTPIQTLWQLLSIDAHDPKALHAALYAEKKLPVNTATVLAPTATA